ncbi:MAG: LuxR C-terminal-related transcriptional regulator [Muribaculaceae bacterium]|nr:LuxR C-terminal-related transcriptional regulator [Muribaculaceae bacterium]
MNYIMKCLPYILVFILVNVVSSCSNSKTKFERDIDNAERVMQSNDDSALAILETIDPTELKVDSLRAKYHYLMVAGFSTKEISVITGQTTSTIYVRKTSIRKKLGVPEKEDIVRYLLNLNKD